ncbi:MAG: hypothetical protein COA78_34540 [Blastopirellula sp.]|nr:MAG: hypothetical protein COA78_34540 [Blastopirellula sp.]
MLFCVLAITGVLAFVRPFSIQVVGLHSLIGFVFITVIGLHVVNNFRPLKRYLRRGKVVGISLTITAALTTLFLLQPAPVKSLLELSGNLGPALDRFEMSEDQMVYQYSPDPNYKLALTVKTGIAYDVKNPPAVAIWLENQGAFHIKTLHTSDATDASLLPYWNYKVQGWEKAKLEAEAEAEIDAVSKATPNGSFDPADYILPADREKTTPYKLLIEINQPNDSYETIADQRSLVYSVEIDNNDPRTFQVLDLVGYPQLEEIEGKQQWSLYYINEDFGTALELIDSSLLVIERGEP